MNEVIMSIRPEKVQMPAIPSPDRRQMRFPANAVVCLSEGELSTLPVAACQLLSATCQLTTYHSSLLKQLSRIFGARNASLQRCREARAKENPLLQQPCGATSNSNRKQSRVTTTQFEKFRSELSQLGYSLADDDACVKRIAGRARV